MMIRDGIKLVVAAAVVLPACGDDQTDSTASAGSTGPNLTTGATSTTDSPTTTGTPTTSATATATATEGSGSATEGTTTSVTTDPTATTDASATTNVTATTEASTDTTGPVGSTGGTSTGTTGPVCVCTPGDTNGCEGDQLLVCADDCLGFEPQPCPGQFDKCKEGACVAPLCLPGSTVCEGIDAVKTCNASGDAFDPPVACGATQECAVNSCVELCALSESTPSSVGCSFFAHKMDNFNDAQPDSVIVGNTHPTKTAKVQLYFVPNGTNTEQPQGAPVDVAPGKTVTFQLTNAAINKASQLRVGGVYRVSSTIPTVAYLHSPLGQQATNDASMLLPEFALKQNYVIASWRDWHNQFPSYFNVIAAQNGTTVKWIPPQNTVAGNGVPAVAAGQTGQVMMNRFDTLQVRAPNGGDLSGTLVEADKPIWVVGAAECINVPNVQVTFCDHIEEQMLPLDYWGKKYVGAASPDRNNEKHYWRIFGGEDGVTVTTTPAQPGTPFMVNKAQFKELVVPNNTSFMIDCSGPCLPVQYLESQNGGAGTGDPAMYQMIPVEQFLDRYAFATGTGYNPDYVQVIRTKGGADVLVDGVVVSGYTAVGNYEVSNWKIAPGGHFAESAQPFGIVSIGYTGVTSYAYPGGMKLQVINPQ